MEVSSQQGILHYTDEIILMSWWSKNQNSGSSSYATPLFLTCPVLFYQRYAKKSMQNRIYYKTTLIQIINHLVGKTFFFYNITPHRVPSQYLMYCYHYLLKLSSLYNLSLIFIAHLDEKSVLLQVLWCPSKPSKFSLKTILPFKQPRLAKKSKSFEFG